MANTTEAGSSSSSGAPETTGTPTTGEPATDSSTGEPPIVTTGDTTEAAPVVCGDGVVGGEEACDDASDEPLDGCDAKCRISAKVLWTQSNDSGGKKDDYLQAVTIDAAGDIYVAGEVTDAMFQVDVLVRKLDPNGEPLLDFTFAGQLGLQDAPRAIAVGADGSIYLGGSEEVVEDEATQGWIRKYDPAGKELWAQVRTSPIVEGSVFYLALALDGDTIYAAGREDAMEPKTYATFVDRIDGDGQQVWTKSIAEAVPSGKIGVAVTSKGDVLLAHGVFTMPDAAQPQIVSYGADGEELWSKTYLPDGGYATAMAVTPDDQILVTGVFFAQSGNDLWAARLDAAGEELWSEAVDVEFSPDFGAAIAPAADGGLYVAGYVTITNQQQNAFVRKYDADGVAVWSDIHDDESGLFDSIAALAVGPDSVVVVGSEFVLTNGQNHWIRAYAP